ncbi:hypothetical protein K2X40_02455 [Candidatus Babeliales bacterium]|nr:hypothetical protein [Candidatus Babeliales bacterium]
MKKLLLGSVLLLGLGMQQAACDSTNQPALNVQRDVKALIEYAQYNNLSDVEILDLAQQAIHKAAHIESAELEVEHSNKKTLLIIAGVVVVVVIVGGVIYYFYNKNKKEEVPKITTAREAAKDFLNNFDFDSMKKHDLNTQEKAYLQRAIDQVNSGWEKAQGYLQPGPGVHLNVDHIWRQYVRENILRAVEESYQQPLTPADLEKVR